MAENQEPNNDWKTVENNETVKKKKGLGPVKGTLLALLIVFLICVIILLIRMEVSGDGDYFAPIKKMFGISNDSEIENDNEESLSNKKDSTNTNKKSSGKYALLSNSATEKGVKHYNITVSLAEFIEISEELEENEDMQSLISPISNNNASTNINKMQKLDFEDDESLYDNNDDLENYDDSIDDYDAYYDLLEEYKDIIDGELYIDLYAKGNEIIQVVLGIDYMKTIENYYNHEIEKGNSEIEEFESADDYAKYIKTTLKLILTKDTLISMFAEQMGSEFGIDEDELSELIDINIDKGLFEFYFNCNDELNEAFADLIAENEDEIEAEGIDPDNFFESMVPVYNKEMKKQGYDFIKITVE